MLVNPVLLGVCSTIGVECLVIVVFVAVKAAKYLKTVSLTEIVKKTK